MQYRNFDLYMLKEELRQWGGWVADEGREMVD